MGAGVAVHFSLISATAFHNVFDLALRIKDRCLVTALYAVQTFSAERPIDIEELADTVKNVLIKCDS